MSDAAGIAIIYAVAALAAFAALVAYFLPTIVAKANGHDELLGIAVVNLLLGWTVIGWMVCLIWSFINPTPRVR